MVNNLRLQLLGDLDLWRDGQSVPPAACQLFKLLVTHRHRTVPSDELIEWLWPDLGLESARNSLWVAVSHLRRVLEPGITSRVTSAFVLTEPPGYRFDPAERCEIDVEAFLAFVRNGQACQQNDQWTPAIDAYLAAQALYRGDYLAQDPYEDWGIPTWERLRDTFLEMKANLAACHLALGRYQEALDHARQVLDYDPCRESAWRLLMEAHYRQGEQDRALRAFERCQTVLAEELGVDPLPETLALHEHILQTPPSLPRRPTAALPPALALRLPFVGRGRERTQLSGILQQALEGRGQVVLVAGEPGIGKTRLLEEVAGLATARGARVLMSCCYEMEQNMAYAPVVEALRPLLAAMSAGPPPCPLAHLAAVAELLPELRQIWPDLPPYQPLPPDAECTRLLTSLAQVIQLCTQDEPLVLLLDDWQWADPSSLQLIHYLARQSEKQPLLHHVLCELWGVGRLPPARAALEEALALIRRLGDRREEVGTLAKLADLLARQGDFPPAVEYACQGLALAEQVDSPAYGAWNRRALGQALAALGQLEEGITHLHGAALTFEALTWRTMLAGSLLRLGLAQQQAGDWASATVALEQVLILSRETHEVYEAAYALAALGELRLVQGETEAGIEALEEAAALVPPGRAAVAPGRDAAAHRRRASAAGRD